MDYENTFVKVLTADNKSSVDKLYTNFISKKALIKMFNGSGTAHNENHKFSKLLIDHADINTNGNYVVLYSYKNSEESVKKISYIKRTLEKIIDRSDFVVIAKIQDIDFIDYNQTDPYFNYIKKWLPENLISKTTDVASVEPSVEPSDNTDQNE